MVSPHTEADKFCDVPHNYRALENITQARQSKILWPSHGDERRKTCYRSRFLLLFSRGKCQHLSSNVLLKPDFRHLSRPHQLAYHILQAFLYSSEYSVSYSMVNTTSFVTDSRQHLESSP